MGVNLAFRKEVLYIKAIYNTIDSKTVQYIIKRREEFASYKTIGREIGIEEYIVNRIIKENSPYLRNLRLLKNQNEEDEHFLNEVKEYYLQNLSVIKTAKHFHLGIEKISYMIKNMGIEIINYQNISPINESIFEVIDTEEKAYWLGFLYADGYIGEENKVELCLKEEDKVHLEHFKRFLNSNNKISFKPNRLGNAYRFSFRNERIHDDLISKGCVQAKSLILTFPTSQIVSDDLIKHFLRGYFDGDGYLGINYLKYTKSPRCGIVGTLDFIKGFVDKLNFNYRDRQLSKKGKAYQYTFSTQECRNMLNIMYDEATIFLKRKYDKYIELKNDLPS